MTARSTAHEAHSPAPYEKEHLMAIRALIAGTANSGQQKLAIDWIIKSACNLYDMSYRPEGGGGPFATAFAEGRRFPANQIVKMTLPETLEAVNRAEQPTRKTRHEAKHD